MPMFGIPVEKRDYDNLTKLEQAIENIRPYLLPGDLLNFGPRLNSWWDIKHSIAYRGIINNQRRIFTEKANYTDIHTALYFSECDIFSVEPPKATLHHLRHFCLEPLSIYRYNKCQLDNSDIQVMWGVVHTIYGTKYDYGQLLDIMINTLLQYSDIRRLSIFDLGKSRKVCSVGVRVVYEYWRKWVEQNHSNTPKYRDVKKLFSSLNPNIPFPNPEYAQGFTQVDVEMTSPAHFANSQYYGDEFRLIARFNNGEIIA